jgi:hypothetical protein
VDVNRVVTSHIPVWPCEIAKIIMEIVKNGVLYRFRDFSRKNNKNEKKA